MGSTGAYEEYEQKIRQRTDSEGQETEKCLMETFRKLGALRQESPDGKAVQKLVGTLQSFITEHYYNCTKEILMGLGEMYVEDERMKQNIDRAGGEGTAEFVRQAILVYCRT